MIIRQSLDQANNTFPARHGRAHRWLFMAFCAACGSRAGEGSTIQVGTTNDTTIGAPAIAPPVAADLVFDPVADSIAQRLVFVPRIQNWFVVGSRGGRLLVDLGRADIDIASSESRRLAFHLVAERISPLRVGDSLRLRGPWGDEQASVGGFDLYNGRIVATVHTATRVDSLARVRSALVGAAVRGDSAAPATLAACDTTNFPRARARGRTVRDSLLAQLQVGEQPVYQRLIKTLKTRTSIAVGCFGDGGAIVSATIWGGDYEWVRELVVLLTDAGKVKPLTVRDFRFRAHELLAAFDADGDGRHDLAARGMTTRAGGTVVLRLTNDGKLERLAAGFAWER